MTDKMMCRPSRREVCVGRERAYEQEIGEEWRDRREMKRDEKIEKFLRAYDGKREWRKETADGVAKRL